jgi:hypothetical protein
MIPPLLMGPYGDPGAEHAERFADYGANAVWFHGFNPQAFDVCRSNNLAPCVEFKTFRADFGQRPELVPIGVDGKPIRYGELVQGVCLLNQAFLDETEEALLNGLRAFRPVGIWFDYLTYTGWFETPEPDLQESCFCPDCIAEFCEATGIDATTPKRILAAYPRRWTEHKCGRIAGFASRYAAIIRTHLPDCIIGAYMCPWTPDEFDGALGRIFAQDYDLLAPSIDVFTPLIYARKSGRLPTWGRDFLDQASGFVPRNRKVQLILDVLDFPDSLQAVVDAAVPSWGIQLFGGASVFSDPKTGEVVRSAVAQMRYLAEG